MKRNTIRREYGIPELKNDFLELADTIDIFLVPLFAALVQKINHYLNLNHQAMNITHIRDVSDPRFATRESEIVCQGRIIDMTVDKTEIDEKDHCLMACKISFSADSKDEDLLENLLKQLRTFAVSYTAESLKADGCEFIKNALQEDAEVCLKNIYSRIVGFYGYYELSRFEEELCKKRGAKTLA
jgi:hypothetical protein